MQIRERLSALDDAFLHIEGPNTPMHVGALAFFDGPAPEFAAVTDMVSRRLGSSPRWRQRLAFVPWGLARPVWIDDDAFEPAHHVLHATADEPGDPASLERLAATLLSQRLDRGRPLWELWFVDGLEGGGFALVSKFHHAMVDGISGVNLGAMLLSSAPEPRGADPRSPAPPPTRDELIGDALEQTLAGSVQMLRRLQVAALDAGAVEERVSGATRAAIEFLASSFNAPPSPLNRAVGPGRCIETVRVQLDDVRAVKDRFGTTINDVVLAAAAGGVRNLLQARGESVDDLDLRVLVPMSLRTSDVATPGNRVAALWAALPASEDDPVRRLRAAAAEMRRLKASDQPAGARLLTSLGDYLPPALLAPATKLLGHQRAFNLAVTNVPGSGRALSCLGRRMSAVYPFIPLAPNTALSIAVLSYGGVLGFGLLGDRDASSDLRLVAEGLDKAVAELRAAV
ncbi:MAG: wax ester/triacylglycerol synthase family O-acyltransferase [Actinomycetota bacterium]